MRISPVASSCFFEKSWECFAYKQDSLSQEICLVSCLQQSTEPAMQAVHAILLQDLKKSGFSLASQGEKEHTLRLSEAMGIEQKMDINLEGDYIFVLW